MSWGSEQAWVQAAEPQVQRQEWRRQLVPRGMVATKTPQRRGRARVGVPCPSEHPPPLTRDARDTAAFDKFCNRYDVTVVRQ